MVTLNTLCEIYQYKDPTYFQGTQNVPTYIIKTRYVRPGLHDAICNTQL